MNDDVRLRKNLRYLLNRYGEATVRAALEALTNKPTDTYQAKWSKQDGK